MTAAIACPCNSSLDYQNCCARYHAGAKPAAAEDLMRARYSAYAQHNVEFIRDTSLPAQQAQLDMAAITDWSQNSQWLGLEVLAERIHADQRHATVEFIAHWQDAEGQHQHQETSLFIRPAEQWYFMILTCHCVQNAMHLARAAVVSSSKNAALPTYKSCQRNDHRLLVS